MLTIDGAFGITSFVELSTQKPKLRLTTTFWRTWSTSEISLTHRILQAQDMLAATIKSRTAILVVGPRNPSRPFDIVEHFKIALVYQCWSFPRFPEIPYRVAEIRVPRAKPFLPSC